MKYSRLTDDKDYKCQPVFWQTPYYLLAFLSAMVDKLKKNKILIFYVTKQLLCPPVSNGLLEQCRLKI